MKLELELKYGILDVKAPFQNEKSETAEVIFGTIYKGDTGETGAQGPKGNTGARGAQGPKGDTGNAGVAVSETAPVDQEVKVWLKPSGSQALAPLDVTITQSTAANLAYVFTKAGFDAVAASASIGFAVSVRVTDNRAAAYKKIDLSGIYPAVWNTTLGQIEVQNPNVARGFYLSGAATDSRGCVTFDTPTYVGRGATFNAATGFYEMNELTDITESEIAYIYSATSSNIESAYMAEMFRGIQIRTNFPPFVAGEINGYSFVNASVAFGNNNAAINLSLGNRYFQRCALDVQLLPESEGNIGVFKRQYDLGRFQSYIRGML